jgi:hypothetical protein
MLKKINQFAIASCCAFSMLACNSSTDLDSLGTLSLSITDAPIDSATEVVVQFNAVELKPQEGESFTINFDTPQSIDLLALQNGTVAPLLDNQILDSGEYNWIRLSVSAEEGELDSYITFEDGASFSLSIPSGSNSGLKLNRPFIIPAGGVANFTIDFDLRKSITVSGNNSNDYKLRPTLRILDNSEVGTISGYITSSLVANQACEQGLAVYAYTGSNITPDDEGSVNSPLTSSMPEYDSNNDRYDYQLSFLPVGDYTVAVTCDADLDDPEIDDADWSSLVSQQIGVTENQISELNFE